MAWLLKLQSKMLGDAYLLLATVYMTKNVIVKRNREYNYFGNVLQYKYNYFVFFYQCSRVRLRLLRKYKYE